jgi:anti-sigma factor RsiW
MRNHDDYNLMIQLFIDDELTGEEREGFVYHLKNCPSCQEELDKAKAFSVKVREARPRIEAPAALRERILSQMNNSVDRAITYPLVQKESMVRPYWKPLSAAAMFCIAVSGVLTFFYFQREFRARSFVNVAVVEHRAFGSARPLEVQSSSPEVVTAWFSKRVSFPFRIPNAGIAADDRANYTLTGGRLVKFAGESAALLEFKMPNNRISLLISSNKLSTAAGGKITYANGLRFHARDLGDLHVATWDNKGLTYALISSVAMSGSRSCSTCHRDSPKATAALKSPHISFLHAQLMPEISANQLDPFPY